MRVFVLLRSQFFVVVLTVLTAFLAHSQLCINYQPHDIQNLQKSCEEALNSIARVLPPNPADVASISYDISNEINEQNKSIIDKWYRIPVSAQDIRVNVRTCFDFSLHEMLTASESDSDANSTFSSLLYPLRLTLILIVSSFLLGVLDLSARAVLRDMSLIQCLAHNLLQILIWGYILVSMEIYRRSWNENWLQIGQPATEIPVYPLAWCASELLAFILILLSVSDALFFNYLPLNIKLINSQGAYKCIQKN